MGLLDNLENQAVGSLLGRSSNPLAAGLMQLIQTHPGGLQGVLQLFHQQGMGGLVSSWVANGENLSISPDQVHQALGSERVQQIAEAAGISPDVAKSSIAQLLPGLVDHLTPNGQVPEQGTLMEMASGLLKNLTAKAS